MDYKELRKELCEVDGLGDVLITRIMEHLERKKFVREPDKYWCSWNGECYDEGPYDSLEEALEGAKEANVFKYKKVWIGTAEKATLRWNSNEEEIIESMIENLCEDCGEYGEDALDVTVEQELDLAKMIDEVVSQWIRKHDIKVSCFTVRDGREFDLTGETEEEG